MMKYKLIKSALGVLDLSLQAGLFGGKPYVKFDEEQLDKIEKSLFDNSATELQELKATQEQILKKQEALENAIGMALKINNIEPSGDSVKNIENLGMKCKEYGESQNRHPFIPTDGKDRDLSNEDAFIGGVVDPNDDIYKTLKNKLG